MKIIGLIMVVLISAGCASHQKSLHSTKEREMTVGIVQKEIRTGMSQADVAEALGSPNIVTKDSEQKETWIYDKIATEVSYSSSSGSIAGAGAGAGIAGSTLLIGGVGGGFSKASGASAQTQKTLTVVIKFTQAGTVESFSYHASKF